MIEAVIFDMDGLLIDSEPLWKKAEQVAFKQTGISLTYDMCAQTTGYDSSDVIKHWFKFQPWDKNKFPFEKIKRDIEDELLQLLNKEGKTKEGVEYIINYFIEKQIPLALASSSPMKIIEATIKKINLSNTFNEVISSEIVEYGKPHPGVYIKTLNNLKANPLHTLAFEDSFYGLLAAKSARLNAIGVLEKEDFSNTKFNFADLKLQSLMEFNDQYFDFFYQMN